MIGIRRLGEPSWVKTALQTLATSGDLYPWLVKLTLYAAESSNAFQQLTRLYFSATSVCRNIRPLFNFSPPATNEEIEAASLQFVRKISGFSKPSKINEESFRNAVVEIAAASSRLLYSLESKSPRKNREEEAAKARCRSVERFR